SGFTQKGLHCHRGRDAALWVGLPEAPENGRERLLQPPVGEPVLAELVEARLAELLQDRREVLVGDDLSFPGAEDERFGFRGGDLLPLEASDACLLCLLKLAERANGYLDRFLEAKLAVPRVLAADENLAAEGKVVTNEHALAG